MFRDTLLFSTFFFLIFIIFIEHCKGDSELQQDASVIILGAGAAGIQAAAELTNQGITDFIIIEQADRIGGRMWQVQWENVTIELGANWIEGTPANENPLWTIAKEIQLQGETTDLERHPLMYNDNGKQDTKLVADIWARLDHAMALAYFESLNRQFTNQSDMSLRDALTQFGWSPSTPMEKTAEYFYVEFNFEYGAEDVSLFNYFYLDGSYRQHNQSSIESFKAKRLPRNLHSALQKQGVFNKHNNDDIDDDDDGNSSPDYFVTDERGYVSVIDYIADSFLIENDPRLLLNTIVSNIAYDNSSDFGPITIQTSNGTVYTSNQVICTFSVGVLNDGFDRDLFTPPVPDWKREAFSFAEDGTYTKIFLKFKTNFWDDWVFTLYADNDEYGYYPVWQNMEALGMFFPENANVYMVTVVNTESERIESQNINTTIHEISNVLKKMYNFTLNEDYSIAEDIKIPIWYHNDYFKGSYSNIKVNNNVNTFINMEKNIGGLWFAGEASDYDWNGYVTGAYFSGQRVARCVALSQKEGTSVPCPQN